MSEKENIVTIDGPSGVGKSTISRKVAAELGFTYLDTGAMYRAVAWYCRDHHIPVDDEAKVSAALNDISIQLLPVKDAASDVQVLVSGKDVSRDIRLPEMAMAASAVSKLASVRTKLTSLQQQMGREGRIIAEGRDTGTVVFPRAKYKFFLDATPEERCRRRVLQLQEKGEKVDEKEILAQTIERDKNDRERSIAPLIEPEDACIIDTTELALEDVIDKVLEVIAGGC